jgi:hypothetical protein
LTSFRTAHGEQMLQLAERLEQTRSRTLCDTIKTLEALSAGCLGCCHCRLSRNTYIMLTADNGPGLPLVNNPAERLVSWRSTSAACHCSCVAYKRLFTLFDLEA